MTMLMGFISQILFGILYIIIAIGGILVINWPITLLTIIYFISCDASGTWVESSTRGAYPRMSNESK